MKITLIICTMNRADKLAWCLDSVAQAAASLPQGDVDLVLVDNNSTDDTVSRAQAWAASASLPVQIVVERRKGSGAARNAGLNAATGDLICFTDDDCRLSPSFFLEMIAHFRRDNRLVLRGGRVDPGDPKDIPFTILTGRETVELDQDTHPGYFLLGCNLAMSRAVMEKVGLFDERFGAGAPFRAAEDTDYLYRARQAGVTVQYVPNMAVAHFHGRNDEATIRKLNYGYHFSGGALYCKHIWANWRFGRHFIWDFRKAVAELFGGPKFQTSLGLSHGTNVLGNLHGAAFYLMTGLTRRFR